MKHWTQEEPKEVMSRIYWQRGQLLPENWQDEWPKIKAQLEAKDEKYIPVHLRNQAE